MRVSSSEKENCKKKNKKCRTMKTQRCPCLMEKRKAEKAGTTNKELKVAVKAN